MRMPWCSSYFSLRPRRIEIVSSTVGSSTNTGWKRRASAASFSIYLRYSSSVVAPTQCSSPRASAGFSRLEASIAPSALPAPTSVCISSMNRMILPSAAVISLSTAFSRSSNSPRYFAPAISAPEVERQQRLVLEAFRHVAIDDADARGPRRWRSCRRRARRSAPGCSWCGATAPGWCGGFPRRGRSPGRACRRAPPAVRSRAYFFSASYCDSRPKRSRRCGPCGSPRSPGSAHWRSTPADDRILPASRVLLDRQRQQQPLDGDEPVAGLLRRCSAVSKTRAISRLR